jgi:hypothetical protein
MATNYYGGNVEPIKMSDYGYGTDHLDGRDPYSFGGYSTTTQPPPQQGMGTNAGAPASAVGDMYGEEQPKKKGLAGEKL